MAKATGNAQKQAEPVEDTIPERMRYWVSQKALEGAGGPEYCDEVVEQLRLLVGRPCLVSPTRSRYVSGWRGAGRAYAEELTRFFLETTDFGEWLGGLEYICVIVENRHGPAVFEEMNGFFGIYDFPWRYQPGGSAGAGQFIRVDGEDLYVESVEPAFRLLLSNAKFANAHGELQLAFRSFDEGKHGTAILEACKAFESTMKVVCELKDWPYAQSDTASKLINILVQNGLFPSFWQNHLNSLAGMLGSVVPTARNKMHAHGAGVSSQLVDRPTAKFVLISATAAIEFLATLAG